MIAWPASRWELVVPVRTDAGVVALPERAPFAYRDRADTQRHTVVPGDTLALLAGHHFAPLPRACGYWWAIAEFQPAPIVDPTRMLAVGRVLHLPSVTALEAHLRGER